MTLLEESKLFAQAAPRSPTTKIQPGPGEIFDLGAQLRPLPPPPPIALVAADTAANAAPPTARRRPARRRRSLRSAGAATARARRAAAPPAAAARRDAARETRSRAAGAAAPRRTPAANAPAPDATPPTNPPPDRLRPRIRPRRHPRTELPARRPSDAAEGCQNVTPAFAARMTPAQQRATALAILVGLVRPGARRAPVPVLMLHRHYDEAIAETTDRVDRDAPGRRAGARAAARARCDESARRAPLLPEEHRAESRRRRAAGARQGGGREQRRADHDEPEHLGARRRALQADRRQRPVLRDDACAAESPAALESQQPYTVVDNLTVRPLNAFRGFKPAAGAEPEVNVQLDVVAFAYAEPAKPAPAPAPAPRPRSHSIEGDPDECHRFAHSQLAGLGDAVRRDRRVHRLGDRLGACADARACARGSRRRRSR